MKSVKPALTGVTGENFSNPAIAAFFNYTKYHHLLYVIINNK